MASVLRQLSDADLEHIHHMIRRDAEDDLAIAKEAEKRLGKKIAKSDHAKAMVVHRYRNSQAYKAWLKRFHNLALDAQKHIREVKAKYELLSKVLDGDDIDGVEQASKTIQARLLLLAQEADDEELKMASGAKGWVSSALRISREMLQDKWRRQVEDLKREIERMGKTTRGKISSEDLVARVDKIMGLA